MWLLIKGKEGVYIFIESLDSWWLENNNPLELRDNLNNLKYTFLLGQRNI